MSAVDGLSPADLAAMWRSTATSMRDGGQLLSGVDPARVAGYTAALDMCAEQIERLS